MNKRIFSLLLAVALVLTFAPFAPVAANAEEATELPHPITEENAGSYYCSHCKENVEWTVYTSQTNGHCYLAADTTMTGQAWVDDDKVFCLNLNGYTLTNKENTRAFMVNNDDANAVMPVLSLMGAGTVNTNRTTGENGGMVYVHANGGIFNVYDEVVLNTKDTSGTEVGYGIAGYVAAPTADDRECTMNLYGGTWNTAGKGTRGSIYVYAGATLNVGGAGKTATINGVTGAGVSNGGAFQNAGTTNLYAGAVVNGGVIKGTGTGNGGGAIYNNGTLNMYMGSAVNGSALTTGAPGAAVHNTSSATYNMYGGTITGGSNTALAGSVYNLGTFNMYNGTITGGSTSGANTASGGGNILQAGKTFNMYGGTISGGVCTSSGQGGNINVKGGTFTMDGGIITGGTVANNGGNVHVTGGNFVMNGGTVSNGTSSIYGGNICVNGGTITVTSGTITGGTASKGGNLELRGSSRTHNISDCIITDGIANEGGNVNAVSGTTVLNHCVLLGNETLGDSNKGHNLFVSASQTVTLNDCYVKMMASAGSNGSVYVSDGTTDAKTTMNLKNSAFPINGTAGAGQNFKVLGANVQVNIDGMTTIQQLFVNTSAMPGIEFKKGFVGSVGIRNQQTVTVGTAAPATMTYETGYTGLGNVYQAGATAYLATYAPAESNTFYIAESGRTEYFGISGKAQLNFYHGYSGIGGGYMQRWFATAQDAVDAYAAMDCDYAFIRLTDAVDTLTFEGSDYHNNSLMINLNGKNVGSITLADGSTLNLMNAGADATVDTVNGGTVAKVFDFANGQSTYVTSQDDEDAYHSAALHLNTKAYLRTKNETLGFQADVSTKTWVAGEISEMGVKLYKDGGETLMETVAFTDAYTFTATALEELHTSGSYNAARVAIESDTSWWASDITATTYVVIDGEVYESELKTVNYKEAVEAMYNDADYHETVKAMIENTTHEGAYGYGWSLVAPDVAA